jgi:hypothetical protein
VGSEINGKSKLFSRPVVIYKKLAHGFYFVVPTTTQDRKVAGSSHFGSKRRQCWRVCTKRALSIIGVCRLS